LNVTQKKLWKEIVYLGEITVKGIRGTKVKVLFQGVHMTGVIFALVYNLKFCILNTPFNICILDINIFWLQIDFISFILCIHALYHIYMNNFY
jgi:hypothetical protein